MDFETSLWPLDTSSYSLTKYFAYQTAVVLSARGVYLLVFVSRPAT